MRLCECSYRLESSFAKIAMNQWDTRQTDDVSNRGAKPANDSNASAQMKLFIETPTGKTITLSVKPSESIERVKEKIGKADGIRLGRKQLQFRGIKLEEDRSLADYNIKKESILRLVHSCR